MIEKMTRYSFVLLSAEGDKFLSELQEIGVVDITRSLKPVDEKSSAMLSKTTRIADAIKTLSELDYSKDSSLDKIKALAGKIEIEGCKLEATENALKNLQKAEADFSTAKKELREAEIWGDIDKDKIAALEAQGLGLRFYKSASRKELNRWVEDFPIEIIDQEGKETYFVAVGDGEFPFAKAEVEGPKATLSEYRENVVSAENRILEAKATLLCLKEKHLDHMKGGYARKTAELERYLAGNGGSESAEGMITVYEGFAPSSEDASLEEAFKNLPVLVLSEDAKVEDNPPVKFKNNRFVSMFETITDMYGRPAYNGFDPTPYITVFFLLFFAMCMGDAGYGLVLILAGLVLGRNKEGFGKFGPMIVSLGVMTTIVGLFMHTFFSLELLDMAWIPDSVKKCMLPATIAGYDGAMVASIVIGIVHLSLAMIVKTVYATKVLGFWHSLSVWGWTLFLVGSVVVGAVALIGVIDTSLAKTIIIVLGSISAIGIFPLRTLGKNPLINIGAGLWETYNTATGILGDVLSYLRLYALGLAGAKLGLAFNELALMARGDGGFGGWTAFVALVIVGHTLNIAMAALGAFVHPLRLNFLEFFKNSGYEPVGKTYTPLKK